MSKDTAKRIRGMIEMLRDIPNREGKERQISVILAFVDGYIQKTLER